MTRGGGSVYVYTEPTSDYSMKTSLFWGAFANVVHKGTDSGPKFVSRSRKLWRLSIYPGLWQSLSVDSPVRRPIPVVSCMRSKFVERRTVEPSHLEIVRASLCKHGFDHDRPIGVRTRAGDSYEVFWGWVRLQAVESLWGAQSEILADVYALNVPDREMVRLATANTGKDAAFRDAPLVDKCAEYYRLVHDEGWRQSDVAEFKGVARSTVTSRLKIHEMLLGLSGEPAEIAETLSEAHLTEVVRLECSDERLSSWATTAALREEMLIWIRRRDLDSKRTRADVGEWLKGVTECARLLASKGDERPAYMKRLVELRARTPERVQIAFRTEENCHKHDVLISHRHVQKLVQKATPLYGTLDLGMLIQGDNTLVHEAVPDGIKAIITDPPYGVGWQAKNRDLNARKIENDQDPKTAAITLRNALTPLVPKLARDAWVIVFTALGEGYGLFFNVLADLGLKIDDNITWVKDRFSQGNTERHLGGRHETAIVASMGTPIRNTMVKRAGNVFFARRDHSQELEHATQKPISLMRQIIESYTFPRELVIDPFAGSASTLIAAASLGRRSVGIELDKDNYAKACERLATLVAKPEDLLDGTEEDLGEPLMMPAYRLEIGKPPEPKVILETDDELILDATAPCPAMLHMQIDSPRQLREVFRRLGIKPEKETKVGS